MIEWLSSDQAGLVIAGVLGGIVRWLTLRHSWQEGILTMIVGGICASYLGPLMLPLVTATIGPIAEGADLAGLSAFLVGIAGISLAGFLIDVFDARFLKGKLPTKKDKEDGDA